MCSFEIDGSLIVTGTFTVNGIQFSERKCFHASLLIVHPSLILTLGEKYFAIPMIVKDLLTAGAKRGKDLTFKTGIHESPVHWDETFAEISELGSAYVFGKQPFYKQWKIFYDLMDNE